jgi:dihydropteroate synthase
MRIGQRDFDFSRQVYVMGILNATPDSFSDSGLYLDPERALDRALQMEEEGADIVDVGGESTRPGSDPIPIEEELERVLPVLKKIISRLKIPVSIDTQKAHVAEAAFAEGVVLLNDVSALGDSRMPQVVIKAGVPVILMHKRGESKTMQEEIHYEDVVLEISSYLNERIRAAVDQGISRDKILIDPGIGFGKRVEDNLEILKRLSKFKKLECPIVFGSSRKSFIRKLLGEDPQQILLGSLATALLATERGVSILRVHDVKETKQTLRSKVDQSPLFHLAYRSLFL